MWCCCLLVLVLVVLDWLGALAWMSHSTTGGGILHLILNLEILKLIHKVLHGNLRIFTSRGSGAWSEIMTKVTLVTFLSLPTIGLTEQERTRQLTAVGRFEVDIQTEQWKLSFLSRLVDTRGIDDNIGLFIGEMLMAHDSPEFLLLIKGRDHGLKRLDRVFLLDVETCGISMTRGRGNAHGKGLALWLLLLRSKSEIEMVGEIGYERSQ